MTNRIEQASLKKNVILNTIRTLMSVIFPLVSFPYASRILGSTGLGKVTYTISIVNYFVMLSSLGIPTYAIREGAKIRDDKEALGKFVTEILILNLFSTLISLMLFWGVLQIPNLNKYRTLLLLESILIPMSTIGISWLYQIVEDYRKITITSTAFQFLSLIMLFLLVKTDADYFYYALIQVISSVGVNIIYLVASRRYVKLFGYGRYNISKHIKPILIIFGLTVASTIYLNMDMTMLGSIKGDAATGIYSVASKVVNIICTMIASLSSVILARLSYYKALGRNRDYTILLRAAAQVILMISIPCMVGVFVLSKDIILALSGNEFLDGAITMRILSGKILLSPLNGFFAYQVLMPIGKEKNILYATIIGCGVNLVLNSSLIPIASYNGAAIGTVLAETSVCIVCLLASKSDLAFKDVFGGWWKYMLSSVLFGLVDVVLKMVINNIIYRIVIIVIISALIYLFALLLFKNDVILTVFGSLREKMDKIS